MTRVMLLMIVVMVAGCDQASKAWADRRLDGERPIEVVSGRLDLRYTENPGMAFSAEKVLPGIVESMRKS